jgi:Cu(I)-responsive transcriptional regulator
MTEMNIGQAAANGGVSAKMIRHYESIGLINPARRTDAGYRVYGEKDVHTLRFIRQARSLGFSITQIRELLSLWQNQRRSSNKVKELALNHIHDMEERISELQQLKQVLEHLVHHCRGDERPDCPILKHLAQGHSHTQAGVSKKNVGGRLPGRRRNR